LAHAFDREVFPNYAEVPRLFLFGCFLPSATKHAGKQAFDFLFFVLLFLGRLPASAGLALRQGPEDLIFCGQLGAVYGLALLPFMGEASR
jgi:hypothetical protein